MMNRILTLVAALGLILNLSVISANAGAQIAVGGIFNNSTFDTSGSEIEKSGDKETNSTSVSEDVDFGSIFVEGVTKYGESAGVGLTLGFEYIPGAAKIGTKTRSDTNSEGDTGVYTGSAEVSQHVGVYLEPTIYATDWLGIYAKGGLSSVVVRSLEAIDHGSEASVYEDARVKGTMYGAGIRLTPWAFVIKAEYTDTNYDDFTLDSDVAGNGNNKITADPDQKSYRIAIGLQF